MTDNRDGLEILTKWVESLQRLMSGLDERLAAQGKRIDSVVPDVMREVDNRVKRQQEACRGAWKQDMDAFVATEVERAIQTVPTISEPEGTIRLTWKQGIVFAVVIAALVGAPWAVDVVRSLVSILVPAG